MELNASAADDPAPDRLGLWARRGIVIDLRKADLRDVLWQRVDLEGAVLSGAILYNADFTGANLRSANLCTADLRRTYFEAAVLDGTNLDDIQYDPQHTHWPSTPFVLPASAKRNTGRLPSIDRDDAPEKWWQRLLKPVKQSMS